MDNLGTEVTVKVKEAIRAKLKEMKANSSDEIIDYIMLLVTTKKSSTELAKSIDFVMESNTTVFVKWLSTIIKKLQQVTVSTISPSLKITNISENNQTLKSSIKTNEKEQCDDILVCETNDVNLGDSDDEKEELKLNLNVNDENIEASDEEISEEKNCLPKLNVSKSVKHSENKISSLPDEIKQKNCFSPAEKLKTKSYIQINKQNIHKSMCEMQTISIKSHPNITINYDIVSSKKNNGNGSEQIVCKRKRPRISINSDDEDEKYVKLKLPVSQTTEELTKQITKEVPKKNNKNSVSRGVVVKPLESKKDICKTDKTPSVHDLIVQRVDHQRGALALDIAFKYIQQQIGASDKEIAVVKKWRDYAVEMLRSNKRKA